MVEFNFEPIDGFKDKNVFPDPTSEDEARTQQMKPLNQVKDFINTNVVPELNKCSNDSQFTDTNWYFKDSRSGLIKQGGVVTVTFNNQTTSSVAFNFLKPFPNKVFSVISSEKDNNITTRGMFNTCCYPNGLSGATAQAIVLNITNRTGTVNIYWEATGR